MKQFREKRQLEEDTFERERQYQMARDVFEWLSAAQDEQEEHLHRASDKRQPETCNWVLKDPQMQPWIENDSGEAVLWMTGIPGAGKSLICSLIVQRLQPQQRLSTLYYFCSHQSPKGDTCATILRTLAIQLLQQNLDMASLVHQAYLQKGSNRSSPAMKRLLIQVLPTAKTARIVIDGIDECDLATQQEVLKSLIEVQKSTTHYCKLLVSSRDEPQIQKPLTDKIRLKLGDKTVGDLSLYIKGRIKGLQDLFPGIDSRLVKLAEQRLHSKAKGMFLWVRLVTDMLNYQTSEMDIERAIDQLPEGLDEAYGLIQARIDSLRPLHLRHRAFNILYWVCVARRPVSIYEVADGIVLNPGQNILSRRTRCNNISRDILELCAPLLERLNNGVLDLVHFSAKEYFVHEHSGPHGAFINIAEAHLSIALSCIINLTSCLDLIPRNADGISEMDLESRVVQGSYGLQSYGQEFWAEHVLAYLGEAGSRNSNSQILIGALENFSQAWKHRSHTDISPLPTLRTAEASIGLDYLRTFPTLHRFIAGWLHFKSDFNKMTPSLNSLDAQKRWRLGTDETFLSLIDDRLCSITERLLMMQRSQLPPHIDEHDFKYFISRFNFPCRFHGCDNQYGVVQQRDAHELSHALTFPCLQCDFSGRGFRSRKDLERHTQRYHMSPEDFEIPDDLHLLGGHARDGPTLTPGSFQAPTTGSGRWTERGRKALKKGFHDVLVRLESELEASAGDSDKPVSKGITSTQALESYLGQHPHHAKTSMSLDHIRHKIKEQNYESLADFKSDISVVCGHLSTASGLVLDRRIESICDDQLEKAMSAFPAFANFDHTSSKKDLTADSKNNSTEELRGRVEAFNEEVGDMTNAILLGTRVPYWSQPEEKQFPDLLQRCGRDFAKIADHLKTKTPEEVDQHFTHLLSMGNNELVDSADLADARLEREADNAALTLEPRDAESQMKATDLLEISSDPSHSSQVIITGPRISQFGDPKAPQPPKRMNMDSDENIDRPRNKKRRPRPRALCPHCPFLKDGLRDEYALKRHTERYHTPTRKVWVCKDISINERFLTNCKSCTEDKRYSSAPYAEKHLRKVHFNAGTSAETLQRWIREVEEPNPRMQNRLKDSASPIRPTTKGQRTRRTALDLPPLKGYSDGLRTLPSMNLETGGRRYTNSVTSPANSSSLDDDLEDEDVHDDTDAREASISTPEAQSCKSDVFLEDISFDNLLPGNENEPRSLNSDCPPHHFNRGLIMPNQVPRLPNLDSFRKAACLDQVEALHHRLDNAPMNSSQYMRSLEDLASLSRLLMKNLRDWQKLSTLAPDIPFSI